MKPHLYLFTIDNINKVEKTNGIYFFYNIDKNIIYIGKSVCLKDRLMSYKDPNLFGKSKSLVKNIRYFAVILLNSEAEALINEALMIKKFRPKYNIVLKDDKSYLYVKVTKSTFPIIKLVRKKDLKVKDVYYGPFPTSRHVRRILKVLRRIFPFSTHKLSKIPCFQSQIGLCDPCPNYIENLKDEKEKILLSKIYRNNIKNIKYIFDGNVITVKKEIMKKIEELSETQEYEKAVKLRDNLQALEYIGQRTTEAPELDIDVNYFRDKKLKELRLLKKDINNISKMDKIKRIECFDIAHISGSYTTGSMVVFINGIAEKSLYRQFKIRHKKGANDYASILEIAQRRYKHLLDWGTPDLIIVDGGKGQLKQFLNVFNNQIKIVSFAKLTQKLIIPKNLGYNEIVITKKPYSSLVLNLIDEAHRFSRRYHHILISKSIFKYEKNN